MHKFNLGLKLFAPKSFHVNTQLWSPSSVLLSGAKNQSSSHRHRVPASKPLDNETMQGNVQHQWTYTSCPRLPVFTEIFPVIFMMLPGYTHVHSCIFDTFWWLSKNTTNQISQTPNTSPIIYQPLAEFPYAATSLSQFHLGGFETQKDPNQQYCVSVESILGVAQWCWSQFFGLGYLVSMGGKPLCHPTKDVKSNSPNPNTGSISRLVDL